MSDGLALALKVQGSLWNQEFQGMVGKVNGETCIIGELDIDENGIFNVLGEVNNDLGKFAKSNNLPCISNKSYSAIKFIKIGKFTSLSLDMGAASFIAISKDNSALLAFGLSVKEKPKGDGLIDKALVFLDSIAVFFGIEEVIVIYRSRLNISLQDAIKKVPSLSKMKMLSGLSNSASPSELDNSNLIISTEFNFEGKESIFTKAIYDLFGLKSLDMFIGISKDSGDFLGILAMPSIDNKLLIAKEFYIEFCKTKSDIALKVKGKFILKILPDIEFIVNCSMGMTSFLLSAEASVKKTISLIGEFKIGDTALLIGYEKALTFGMFTTLYLRDLSLFSAVILKVLGNVAYVQMLSAAVSEISLSSLVKNFTGITVSGLEDFDIIKLKEFDFCFKKDFPTSILEKKEKEQKEKIVEFFNKNIEEESLRLSSNQCKITNLNNGIALVDKKRMRHYFIDRKGKMYLRCQFYTSFEEKEIEMGDYKLQPGMFICGVLEILGVNFKVLFSMNPNEGILAFMHVDEIDIGFLKFTSSSFKKDVESKAVIPSDSPVYQFIDKKSEGPLLYISINKNNSSFYIDGSLTIWKIFSAETRIIVSKGFISIDARAEIFSMFMCTFGLHINYQSASALNFDICLIIDTSGIEKFFGQVKETLDRAIESYKEKVKSAERQINEAQEKVNSLMREIDSLNSKIERCKRRISDASWWKKWAVAMKEGIEIAAYEVAKAGVYVAIGNATAVLQAAKLAINLSAKIGEAVVEGIKAVLDGILNLFYIRRFEIRAAANLSNQSFEALIEFVALGKEYTVSKKFENHTLGRDTIKLLEEDMDKNVSLDVSNIERIMRNNKRKFKPEIVSAEVNKKRIEDGMLQIENISNFIRDIERSHLDEFGESIECAEALNTSLAQGIDIVSSNMSITSNMIDVNRLENIVQDIKQVVNDEEQISGFRDREVEDINSIVTNLNKVIEVSNKCESSMDFLVEKQNDSKNKVDFMNDIRKATIPYSVRKGNYRCDMGKVLNDIENSMIKNFSSNRSNYYMNFAKEGKMYKYLDEEREKYETSVPDDLLQKRRSIKANNYKERL